MLLKFYWYYSISKCSWWKIIGYLAAAPRMIRAPMLLSPVTWEEREWEESTDMVVMVFLRSCSQSTRVSHKCKIFCNDTYMFLRKVPLRSVQLCVHLQLNCLYDLSSPPLKIWPSNSINYGVFDRRANFYPNLQKYNKNWFCYGFLQSGLKKKNPPNYNSFKLIMS